MKNIFLILILVFLGCEQKQSKEVKAEQKTETKKRITIKKGDEIVKQNEFVSYDIKGQKQIRISPTGEENNITKNIGALVDIKKPYEKLNLKLIKKTLSKNFILKCSSCHNDYANGIIGPSLIHKNKDEIFNMISSYKQNTKSNVLMRDLVKHMDDEEILSLANEIHQFNQQFRSKE